MFKNNVSMNDAKEPLRGGPTTQHSKAIYGIRVKNLYCHKGLAMKKQ